MAIRNFLFKQLNKHINIQTEQKFGFLLPGGGTQLSEKLENVYNFRELAKQKENIDNYVELKQSNNFEKEKYQVLRKYANEGRTDPLVDANDVLLQFDKIQVLQDLKWIEENEGHQDPEEVRYAKLRARVLLGEEGAVEEYNEYVKDRPYVTKYEKWTNLSEKRMHHLVE